ncbi:hypothetical protein BV898_09186 [Hypsibius exemplaris]|uniref:Signal recognition particle receptor subunit beta n=1 Tax=Hypsibius exemplaris TaxID=2072580 RepID=A0A1W0WNA1_HYPEX|nr:hypothetical protein BV898_09186 [Hypsibius exemplaris]
MFVTLSVLGLRSLAGLLYREDLLDLSTSPLLPLLGTSAFIAVGGYYWRKQQRRVVLSDGSIMGPLRRNKRRKTLLLTPITLAEISPNERKRSIVVLGLAGAGKTAFLNKLLHFSTSYLAKDPQPTLGVKMTSVDLHGLTQTYYEVGGAENTRMFAKEFLHMANLVIFVVDASSSAESLAEARDFFQLITKEKDYAGPVVVMAGKQDLPGARSVREIYEALAICDTDDVYVLPACSAPKSRDTDDVLDGAVGATTTDLTDRNHHGIIQNLLYRTFI